MAAPPILQMTNITKRFPGVLALDQVDLTLYPGEIHALVGENGAGKSTLMKILTGVYQADSGDIAFKGERVNVDSPRTAQQLGIAIIHQELAVLPEMSVAENIFLGREPTGWGGRVQWQTLYAQTQVLLDQLGIRLSPRTRVGELTVAQQQMVEIAKALSLNADLLVMDEPTSSLTGRETEILFELIAGLKAAGVTVVYISHRMEEIFRICDRITVMRDGAHVATQSTAELTPESVVRLMVGRAIDELYPAAGAARGPVRLEVRNLSRPPRLQRVDLQLHAGEILGLSGLVGSGRTDLVQAIFGVDALESGEILIDGRPVQIRSPQDAIAHGIGLVPEDRKGQGLFLNLSVQRNTVIARLAQLLRFGFIDFTRTRAETIRYVKELDIRTPSPEQTVRNLSGGNQQKVVIARWLALNPSILILDEPTRGIDVGAKAEIHSLMRQLADEGMAILMISSELPEILGVSDRILVMREGRIVAEFDRSEATQDQIMLHATGAESADGGRQTADRRRLSTEH